MEQLFIFVLIIHKKNVKSRVRTKFLTLSFQGKFLQQNIEILSGWNYK